MLFNKSLQVVLKGIFIFCSVAVLSCIIAHRTPSMKHFLASHRSDLIPTDATQPALGAQGRWYIFHRQHMMQGREPTGDGGGVSTSFTGIWPKCLFGGTA